MAHPEASRSTAERLQRRLDAWAAEARHDVEPGAVFQAWLQLAVHTARADEAAVWLRTNETEWRRLALTVVGEGEPRIVAMPATPEPTILEALSSATPSVGRLTSADGMPATRVLATIRQGGQPVGVLATTFAESTFHADEAALVPFLGASADIAGEFLGQHELRWLRREQARGPRWEAFLTAATADGTLRGLAQRIVDDGRLLTGADRLAAAVCRGGTIRVLAVSGVDQIDPRSNTIEAWLGLLRTAAETEVLPDAPAWSAAVAAAKVVTTARELEVVPWRDAAGRLVGGLIAERFGDIPDKDPWRRETERLGRYAAAPWLAYWEREATAWQRLTGGWGHGRSFMQRRSVGIAVVLGLIVLGLWGLPANLIITAEGELRPVTRRDIFAGRSGIIREVLVEHGVEVVAGQELARLSDPAGELDLTRLEGELHTIEARLATLRAARIQAADGGASGRLSQLVGEEAELLERRTALEAQRQQAVVDQAATRIVSPMPGRILTWNVAERLTGRPVERGESLLSVGDVAGSWEITADLRERDVAPVLEALRSRPEGLSVRFAAVAAGGPPCEARVIEVARVVEENARQEPVVRVTMRCVDTPASADWRPGTTVMPRIDCGRYSLGFVWFRDLRTALHRWWWIGW